MPYGDMLHLFDAQVLVGRHYTIRTRSVAGSTPDIQSVLVGAGDAWTSPLSGVILHHFHGASTRIPSNSTAFGNRQDHLLVELIAGWEPTDDADRHRQWAESTSAALAPHALPGGYPNLLTADAHDQVAHAYGENAAQLRAAKALFDPNGVFTATPLP
jgi:hypothetical protein